MIAADSAPMIVLGTSPSNPMGCATGPSGNNLDQRETLACQSDTLKYMPPFHLAIKVTDISTARDFYTGLLGCPEGRSSDTWVDFNFYGHQLVCHLAPPGQNRDCGGSHSNPVDGHAVPVPHFGVVLEMDQWHALVETLRGKEVRFVIEPCTRFPGLPGEQATMILLDPSNNALEFKAFRDIDSQLFKI